MSSARELAEARRARILAKSASRMSIVSGGTEGGIDEVKPSSTVAASTDSTENTFMPLKSPSEDSAPTTSSSVKKDEDIGSPTLVKERKMKHVVLEEPPVSLSDEKKEVLTPASSLASTAEPTGSHVQTESNVVSGPTDADTPSKMGPLAARRLKIKLAEEAKKAADAKKAEEAAASPVVSSKSDDVLDAIVSDIVDEETSGKAKSPTKSPSLKIKAKTIAEIEEEVRRATEAFDDKQTSVEESTSAKENVKNADTGEEEGEKEGSEKSKKKEDAGDPDEHMYLPDGSTDAEPAAAAVHHSRDGISIPYVIKIVRMIMLIVFGCSTGYRFCQTPEFHEHALYAATHPVERAPSGALFSIEGLTADVTGLFASPQLSDEEVHEEAKEWIRLFEEEEQANREATERLLGDASGAKSVAPGAKFADPTILTKDDFTGQSAGAVAPTRTWVQYFIQVIMNKLDRSVLFLSLLSWIMSIVTPMVTSVLKALFPLNIKTAPSTKFNIMDFIMNLQSKIYGYINTTIQEISVHMLSIIVTVMVIQLQGHHGSSPNRAFDNGVGSTIANEL